MDAGQVEAHRDSERHPWRHQSYQRRGHINCERDPIATADSPHGLGVDLGLEQVTVRDGRDQHVERDTPDDERSAIKRDRGSASSLNFSELPDMGG